MNTVISIKMRNDARLAGERERLASLRGDTLEAAFEKGFREGLQCAALRLERDFLDERAIRAIQYWEGVAECDCASPLPHGGCLKCDMARILDIMKPKK